MILISLAAHVVRDQDIGSRGQPQCEFHVFQIRRATGGRRTGRGDLEQSRLASSGPKTQIFRICRALQPGNFVSCHRKPNPASIQIGNLAGFCKSMQNSAEAAGQREPPSQSATNRTSGSGNGSLRNASKCSEMFRNAPLGMTYCLGGPAIAASAVLLLSQIRDRARPYVLPHCNAIRKATRDHSAPLGGQ